MQVIARAITRIAQRTVHRAVNHAQQMGRVSVGALNGAAANFCWRSGQGRRRGQHIGMGLGGIRHDFSVRRRPIEIVDGPPQDSTWIKTKQNPFGTHRKRIDRHPASQGLRDFIGECVQSQRYLASRPGRLGRLASKARGCDHNAQPIDMPDFVDTEILLKGGAGILEQQLSRRSRLGNLGLETGVPKLIAYQRSLCGSLRAPDFFEDFRVGDVGIGAAKQTAVVTTAPAWRVQLLAEHVDRFLHVGELAKELNGVAKLLLIALEVFGLA